MTEDKNHYWVPWIDKQVEGIEVTGPFPTYDKARVYMEKMKEDFNHHLIIGFPVKAQTKEQALVESRKPPAGLFLDSTTKGGGE